MADGTASTDTAAEPRPFPGSCFACRRSGWRIAPEDHDTRKGTAQCRRYPPSGEGRRKWPTITWDDGCGEFRLGADMTPPPLPSTDKHTDAGRQ